MKFYLPVLLLAAASWNCNNEVKTSSTASETTGTAKPAAPPAPVADANSQSKLPSFRMTNSQQQVIDLAQYRGKKVFVNLWATWCPPCRAEIPSIESLAQKTDRSKVEFVMLSLDDNFDKALTYTNSNKMKLPVYYPAATLPELFTVDGIPVTYIFNEKGEIVFQQVGSENYDTQKFLDLLK